MDLKGCGVLLGQYDCGQRFALLHLKGSKHHGSPLSLVFNGSSPSFVFTASHQHGRDNSIADALSRFDFQHFRHLAPHVVQGATPVPPVPHTQHPVI